MAGVNPKFRNGPVTYFAVEAIAGGQLVEGRTGSVIGVAGANSLKCLGVARRNIQPATTDTVNGTTISGYPAIDVSGDDPQGAIDYDVIIPLTYTAACAFGMPVKCAANGAVAPWVDGTDTAGTKIGQCREPAGVSAAGPGLTRLY